MKYPTAWRVAGIISLLWSLPDTMLGQLPMAPRFADAHVHLNDASVWIQMMNETGIDRAVVLRGRSITSDGLLQAALQWPTRFIPFLSVSPEHREFRSLWETDSPRLGTIVDSLLRLGGFVGVGEISATHFASPGFPEADFDPNGGAMRAIVEAAQHHQVPVIVHIEVTRIREFQHLLQDFGEVTFIWAHGGYTPMVLAEQMLIQHPNLMYELSARTWTQHPRSPDYTILRNGADVWPEWIALIERMPSRFIVGTDASMRSVESDRDKIQSVQNLLRQLSPETRRLVASDNLSGILQRSP